MAKTTKSVDEPNTLVPAKIPLIIAVDQEVNINGKTGKIIWVGSSSYDKDVKVRWSDGSIEFFSSKELN